MEPLYEAHKRFALSCPVVHADETPVAMLDPAGKTKRAYIWAYARGELDAQRGVIYGFCLGRGSQYPVAFLGAAQSPPGSPPDEQPAWSGTLVCDQYAGYDRVLDRRVYPQRIAANCVAHARRKFDELVGTSEVAKEAIKRIGWISAARRTRAPATRSRRARSRRRTASRHCGRGPPMPPRPRQARERLLRRIWRRKGVS